MSIDHRLLTALTVILTLIYPLAIWFGKGQVEPRWLAVLLLVLVATRLPALKISKLARWSALCGLMMVLAAVWTNALLPLKLYPVLVNLAFLIAFAYSLSTPQSMVERFARITEPDLPDVAVRYTRNVTKVWCAFFVFNGSMALITAIWASQEIWTLYTGVVSYLLMGSLFVIEYLVRIRFKRRHHV
ncbi:hypothetical protein H8K33_10650 [Undibacterium amnicola]|uniref:DNA gyrase subunit B n=1 Tax=Undibacterium amnicola TaxID=1834038 RepID=A0ABR6XSF5_9BURK|nr:hypothetical protein [Undibacterium amnicola]MBC3831969.1 hypothetical protein [Undibacterium amnicola]